MSLATVGDARGRPCQERNISSGRDDHIHKSAVGDWQRTLGRLFKLTGILRGHAHRFRDTFAVELLLAGVPLERVSILLGHQSTRVTEKHYSPWVRDRQEQLEADVRRTWTMPDSATKGTLGVRGASSLVN